MKNPLAIIAGVCIFALTTELAPHLSSKPLSLNKGPVICGVLDRKPLVLFLSMIEGIQPDPSSALRPKAAANVSLGLKSGGTKNKAIGGSLSILCILRGVGGY